MTYRAYLGGTQDRGAEVEGGGVGCCAGQVEVGVGQGEEGCFRVDLVAGLEEGEVVRSFGGLGADGGEVQWVGRVGEWGVGVVVGGLIVGVGAGEKHEVVYRVAELAWYR